MFRKEIKKEDFTHSAVQSPVLKEEVKGHGFPRQAQDTEFIEVQGEP
jgi:hypothetical protein